ncbi:MAG TPA: uroporphyrinogen decarboxylase family protein [Thermomicrobiales bacterium]|nr:uroporphyrinogen decarboxylase family protein [Thermomicrobiales bacterium]
MISKAKDAVEARLPVDGGQMTRTERVRAAVRGEPVDRIPVCFWHHFQPEGSGRRLAEATLRFFDQTFDLDIVKVMPDLPYPFPRRSIGHPNGWRLIEPIDEQRSRYFNQRAEAVSVLRGELGYETPIVVTVFSPLAEAFSFIRDRDDLLGHAQEASAVVHEALMTIAENLRAHIRDVIDAGADGVFFALQGCTTDTMSEAQYRELGRPYDLVALQGAVNGWLNILHIHGDKNLMFNQVLDYPVQVLNWSDRLAGPSLRDARGLTSKCLMGGWHEFGALSNGPAEMIRSEAEDAVAQTGGRKFILANGCSVPDDTDEQWLRAGREIANDLKFG